MSFLMWKRLLVSAIIFNELLVLNESRVVTLSPSVLDIMTPSMTASDIITSSPSASDIMTLSSSVLDIMTPSPTASDIMTSSPTASDIMTLSSSVLDIMTSSSTVSDIMTSSPTASDIMTLSSGALDIMTSQFTSQQSATVRDSYLKTPNLAPMINKNDFCDLAPEGSIWLNGSECLLPRAKMTLVSVMTAALKDPLEDEISLVRLFQVLVKEELADCDLVVASDGGFFRSYLMEYIVALPNHKQVLFMGDASDLRNVNWASPKCHGTILLVSGPEILMEFSKVYQAFWDYHAKVVIVGLSRDQLDALVQPEYRKMRKTEHILGIVKGDQPGHYKLYMNALYWGGGLMYVSTWKGRLHSSFPEVFPDKITNIRNHTLNATMFEFPPNIMFRRAPDGTVALRYGFEVDIVRNLGQAFNFSINIKDVSQTELWGKKKPDGTFTGLVGLLGSMGADFGVGNVKISISGGRVEFIEFSSSYLNDEACLLARIEPPLPRWQSIGLPFKLETWLTILIGLILTGPTLYLLALASTKSGSEHLGFLSFLSSSIYCFGLHTRQPQFLLPLRASNQVLVVFLWVYVIILTTGYSCNLTAFLTVVRQPPGVENFKELHDSNLDLFALGPFLNSVLTNSENKYHNAVAKRFYIMPFKEIRTHILSGRGVMINSRGYLEFTRDQLARPNGRPRARLVKECFAPFSVAMAFQIYSPLRDKFSRVLERMLETGLLRRWFLSSLRIFQKFKRKDRLERPEDFTEESEDDDDALEGAIPLGIDHLQGAFIILIFGCLVSTLSFYVEFYV